MLIPVGLLQKQEAQPTEGSVGPHRGRKPEHSEGRACEAEHSGPPSLPPPGLWHTCRYMCTHTCTHVPLSMLILRVHMPPICMCASCVHTTRAQYTIYMCMHAYTCSAGSNTPQCTHMQCTQHIHHTCACTVHRAHAGGVFSSRPSTEFSLHCTDIITMALHCALPSGRGACTRSRPFLTHTWEEWGLRRGVPESDAQHLSTQSLTSQDSWKPDSDVLTYRGVLYLPRTPCVLTGHPEATSQSNRMTTGGSFRLHCPTCSPASVANMNQRPRLCCVHAVDAELSTKYSILHCRPL